jgi:hypothetical protein
MLKGRLAIEQYYHQLFSGPVKITEFTLSHLHRAVAGNLGYTTGTYQQKLKPQSGERLEDSGKVVVIVKRDAAGSWKSAYVIYNSDRPQHTPEGAAVLIFPLPALVNFTGQSVPIGLIDCACWRSGLSVLC